MSFVLNVAIGQCPANLDGPQARLDWLVDLLDRHDVDALDLVVLPELFQCGYNIGALLAERAETSDGAFARAISGLAKVHNTAIAYGYAELQDGKLFNSAQCVNSTGEIVGTHRKLILPPGFEGDHFSPGAECNLFKIGNFSVAFLICYDVEFPENLRHVALAGADIVIVPTALGAEWGVVAENVVPTRAFENGVFVCYANYCGKENGLRYFGGSRIVGPDGKLRACAGVSGGLIVARLEQQAVTTAQNRLPYHIDRLKLPWVSDPS